VLKFHHVNYARGLFWETIFTTSNKYIKGPGIVRAAPTGGKLDLLILLVGKVGDAMERIGLDWINPDSYQRYNKDKLWEFENEDGLLRTDPDFLKPPELVKSWEEVQLG
jgi:hypothetical protein